MTPPTPATDGAEYVFRVRFRLALQNGRVTPRTFETTWFRPAPTPGEAGWLFFRDVLWRGSVNAPDHLRALASETLGVPVDSVTFSELRTSPGYRDALEAAIADELDAESGAFGNATDVATVVKNYLGSSVHVVSGGDDG